MIKKRKKETLTNEIKMCEAKKKMKTDVKTVIIIS